MENEVDGSLLCRVRGTEQKLKFGGNMSEQLPSVDTEHNTISELEQKERRKQKMSIADHYPAVDAKWGKNKIR